MKMQHSSRDENVISSFFRPEQGSVTCSIIRAIDVGSADDGIPW